MELKDRIQYIIDYKGITIPKFANTIGVKTPQAIRELIKGNTKSLSADMRNKILSYMPEINSAWLIAGQGEPFNNGKSHDVNDNSSDYFLVPLVNIDSVGGMQSSNALTSGEQFIERLIPFTGAKPGDKAIYQSGDSMTPTIPPGSIMQIRRVDDWQEYFGYGNTFVLWLRDDRRITKQILKYKPDPQNYVTCHSFNPDSADEELPKRMIREVWKIIKVLTDKGW